MQIKHDEASRRAIGVERWEVVHDGPHSERYRAEWDIRNPKLEVVTDLQPQLLRQRIAHNSPGVGRRAARLRCACICAISVGSDCEA